MSAHAAAPHYINELICYLRIKLRTRAALYFTKRLIYSYRLPVAPPGGKRVKSVHYSYYTRQQRYAFTLEAFGVAFAVPPLMVA